MIAVSPACVRLVLATGLLAALTAMVSTSLPEAEIVIEKIEYSLYCWPYARVDVLATKDGVAGPRTRVLLENVRVRSVYWNFGNGDAIFVELRRDQTQVLWQARDRGERTAASLSSVQESDWITSKPPHAADE
jgi:hypothetical protein